MKKLIYIRLLSDDHAEKAETALVEITLRASGLEAVNRALTVKEHITDDPYFISQFDVILEEETSSNINARYDA